MVKVSRKPRPLSRDGQSLRDDRLFIVACDDTFAPHQYFGFLRFPRVQVHVVPTTDGTSAAKHVLERLRDIEYGEEDERWLLLDTDHCLEGNHVAGFIATLREAQQAGIKLAISHPCFELWLLLHVRALDGSDSIRTAAEVEILLRSALGAYNKTKLRAEDFLLSAVVIAAQRAREMDTSPDQLIPPEGVTRVYLLLESIVSKALGSQLPAELAALKQKVGEVGGGA